MKVNVLIRLFEEDATPQLIADLTKLNPEWCNHGSFSVNLPGNDPRINDIHSIFKSYGFTPKPYPYKQLSKNYRMIIMREHEQSDWEQAELFQPCPKVWFSNHGERNPKTGNIILEPQQAKPRGEIGNASLSSTLVSDYLKNALQDEGMKHATFRNVEILNKGGSSNDTFKGYWELSSDLTLPPLSPKCIILTENGEPWDQKSDVPYYLVDGFYQPPEMQYTASALKAAGAFDVAFSRERFGSVRKLGDPQTIVSRKFYELCTRMKLKMDWRPVKIDSEI